MTSNKYIIKTNEGVKLLTIYDLNSNLYSLDHLLNSYDRVIAAESLGLLASNQ